MRDDNSAIATDDELRSRSRDVVWYQKDLDEVPENARRLLEQYSNIPPGQVKEHVYAVVREHTHLLTSAQVSTKRTSFRCI